MSQQRDSYLNPELPLARAGRANRDVHPAFAFGLRQWGSGPGKPADTAGIAEDKP
jgi:hypothetical protein